MFSLVIKAGKSEQWTAFCFQGKACPLGNMQLLHSITMERIHNESVANALLDQYIKRCFGKFEPVCQAMHLENIICKINIPKKPCIQI